MTISKNNDFEETLEFTRKEENIKFSIEMNDYKDALRMAKESLTEGRAVNNKRYIDVFSNLIFSIENEYINNQMNDGQNHILNTKSRRKKKNGTR